MILMKTNYYNYIILVQKLISDAFLKVFLGFQKSIANGLYVKMKQSGRTMD